MTPTVVFNSFGSYGDIEPFLALGREMQTRGYRVIVATDPIYEQKVVSSGLVFRAVRPSWNPISPMTDARLQNEHLADSGVFPRIRDSFEDLMHACDGADLLVSHPIAYAAPIVAQLTGISWVSVVLQPQTFFSRTDPSLIPIVPGTAPDEWYEAFLDQAAFDGMKEASDPYAQPLYEFRRQLGLDQGSDPFFEAIYSPELVLAMFPSEFAAPQPDWPRQARITGFPAGRAAGERELPSKLTGFLEAGAKPVVFVLSSDSVAERGEFFAESATAARLVGCRSVLAGLSLDDGFAGNDICTVAYAPFELLFARALIVVHHGGIGTLAIALKAGCPMLITPDSNDQPDNAARAVRLGVARSLPRHMYTAESAAIELSHLLSVPDYRHRAATLARTLAGQDGVANACDALEQHLRDAVAPRRAPLAQTGTE